MIADPTFVELGLSDLTREAITGAGYQNVGQLLRAPSLAILKIPHLGKHGYNELVEALVGAGILAPDAGRWGQVPHVETKILSEILFGELTESWLGTYPSPAAYT